MAYVLNTPDETRQMLQVIGLHSLDQLFDMIPAEFRLDRALAVPPALSELELTRHVGELAARNAGVDARPCFLGAGAYDHFVPAAVDQLAGRGEFFTAYTPYQAEASQGTLRAIFEYQTLIAELTGLDVSNASLYDGASAMAEAAIMAISATDRIGRVVVAGSVHPEYRQTVRTLLGNLPPEIITVPARDGRIELEDLRGALTDDTSAVLLQYPNFFGQIEDTAALIAEAQSRGAVAIVSVDPIALGILKRPGDLGADIVTAEGQSLGNHLQYGGPYLGILACREKFLRKLPGRLVGQTTDRHGKTCYVLTLQTREQHIRRDKATSNICTNQGLLALRASIYLALLGPSGLAQAAELSLRKAHYAAETLAAVPGLSLAYAGPFFKEFVLRTSKDAGAILEGVGNRGYHGGVDLGRFDAAYADLILVAVTEKRTKEEIDGLAAAYRWAVEAA